MKIQAVVLLLASATLLVEAFTMSMSSASEKVQLARGRLYEALCSPSGKLTLSPEIIIPEPTDPTALLLQSDAVAKLSAQIRTSAKANSAWLSGSVNALRTFTTEQEGARGNFPGPVPVVYCDAFGKDDGPGLNAVAEAGATGVLVPVLEGKEISTSEEIAADERLGEACAAALDNGLQPIPEVVLATRKEWGEEDMDALVAAIAEQCGGDEPTSVVISLSSHEEDGESAEADSTDEEEKDGMEEVVLPKVSKKLKKRIPILGSVRVTAGEGRMGGYVARLKDAGFTGAFLRCDCVPGFRMNPDLDVVGGFWSVAIGSLKSLKSKNFGFRAKVEATNDVPLAWYNYQKSVMESGALGGNDPGSDPLDAAAGDYKGF